VVLADASGSGLATVVSRDAKGAKLSQEQVEVTRGRAFTVELPRAAALVVVTVERTSLLAAVLASGTGAVVVPFQEPEQFGLVPEVAPAGR
jgi:hypothetical protein